MSILKVNTIQDKGGNTIISSDGSGVITPSFGVGKIGQIVEDSITDATSITTTSSSFVSTGISVSITPSSASSKILVIWSYGNYSFHNDWMVQRITRNGTSVVGDIYFRNTTGGIIQSTEGRTFLDVPNTTSALTYAVDYYAVAGFGTARIGSPSGASLIAMEVLA